MDGKINMSVKVICPYLNDEDIVQLKLRLWNIPIHFEKDYFQSNHFDHLKFYLLKYY